MSVWIKIKDDVITHEIEQEDQPPNDEFGCWIIQPSPQARPGRGFKNGLVIYPIDPNFIKRDAFFKRFQETDLLAIRAGANTNQNVATTLSAIDSAESINLYSTTVGSFIVAVVEGGIIEKEKIPFILAPVQENERPEKWP